MRQGAAPETLAQPTVTDTQPRVDEAEPSPIRLSFSRVDTYLTCPLKYRYAYVDRLPQEPSPDLSWGSSVHAALEAWWDRKLAEPPPLEVLFQALYDNWDDTGFEGMAREEKLKWYTRAREVLSRHYERHAPTYVPAVACEQGFALDLGAGVEVTGVIDHVARIGSGGVGVVDWKTNRRAKPRKQVAESLQLAIYWLAAVELWGHEPDWVAFDFVVPGIRVAVGREELDTDGAVATIHRVADEIRSATSFAPTPSRLCGWCDYRGLCPAFEGDGPDVPGRAVVELERLRRRWERDGARITELEDVVRSRLGPHVLGEETSEESADKPDSVPSAPDG